MTHILNHNYLLYSIIFISIAILVWFIYFKYNSINDNKNMGLSESVQNSRYGFSDIDRIPSPDQNMIPCPLEPGDGEIPLETLLQVIYSYNILEIILFIILLFIIFNKYIYKININIITKFLYKYMPNKFTQWIKNIQIIV
uniref:Uncharacterized protein n=1 Tax=Hericium coralloides TaxID=100756 RepID=A0A1P8NNJ1_HERCO|nr:hypothetical protein [Hericium coralloides]APX41093.1 hypothetical protein [Hericium coralloides]